MSSQNICESIVSFDSFYTDKDKKELSKHQVSDDDIRKFFKELKEHFNTVWCEEYYIKKDFESFSDINIILGDYPSTAGYHILDNAFTFCDVSMTDKSKELLGYFYNIELC